MEEILRSDKEIGDRDYDQFYLSLIKGCRDQGDWHGMRRQEAAYKLTRIREESTRPRLDSSGEFGSMMFIGTNPSIRSELTNIWKDPYGIYFGAMLKEVKIDPKEIYVSNLYKYPTKENRPLNGEEIQEGWDELMLEIFMVNPTILVPLGKQAMDAFQVNLFQKKHCRWGFDIYGLHHPSYTRRNKQAKVENTNHLRVIKQINDTQRIRRRALKKRKNNG